MRILIPLIFFVASLTAIAHAASNDFCLSCHGQTVDKALFERSVHSSLLCTQCHSDISGFPHQKVSKVVCNTCHFTAEPNAPGEEGKMYRVSIHGNMQKLNKIAPDCIRCHGTHYILPPDDSHSKLYGVAGVTLCAECHAHTYADYRVSTHGMLLMDQGNLNAASCTDCHREHYPSRIEDGAWRLYVINDCGICHSRQLDTYRNTFHGKVAQLGYVTVAKCSDCHGSHRILPPGSPQSSLSEENIVQTCRQCHPAATKGFTRFYAHPEVKNRAKYPLLYYSSLFMNSLLILVFGFFIIHTALWGYRSLHERIKERRREE